MLLLPLLILPILVCLYRVYRSRQSLRELMDATPEDMLRADDGKGYGYSEDPSTIMNSTRRNDNNAERSKSTPVGACGRVCE